ncbi:hypothetical protein PoB_006976800 [Plakobranchus ocellatus]|uniref:Uncharacterized protein n=1 Tax=Plakobranchus ocellatus TaxID=259542 RepID=A0AAV4DG52_9GAST|nr:hypothetical protein PoB_006976800 [Plakobranchus ocellatus]
MGMRIKCTLVLGCHGSLKEERVSTNSGLQTVFTGKLCSLERHRSNIVRNGRWHTASVPALKFSGAFCVAGISSRSPQAYRAPKSLASP